MSTKATAFSPTAVDAFVSIESIRVVGRHRQDLGDLKSLADSIADVDLLNPITITADSRLIAGQRRLEACRLLGWGSVPVRIAANLDEAAALLRAERDENTERKDMVLSEKASLGAALYAIEEQAAKARMAEAGRSAAPGRPRERCTELETPFRQAPPGSYKNKTVAVVGEALGMSGTTYAELRYVFEASRDTELPQHVRATAVDALAEMDRTGKVARGASKVRATVRANREAIEAKAAALASPVLPDELDPLPSPAQNAEKPAPSDWIPVARDNSAAAAKKRRQLLTHLAAEGNRSAQIAQRIELLHLHADRIAEFVGRVGLARTQLAGNP